MKRLRLAALCILVICGTGSIGALAITGLPGAIAACGSGVALASMVDSLVTDLAMLDAREALAAA